MVRFLEGKFLPRTQNSGDHVVWGDFSLTRDNPARKSREYQIFWQSHASDAFYGWNENSQLPPLDWHKFPGFWGILFGSIPKKFGIDLKFVTMSVFQKVISIQKKQLVILTRECHILVKTKTPLGRTLEAKKKKCCETSESTSPPYLKGTLIIAITGYY